MIQVDCAHRGHSAVTGDVFGCHTGGEAYVPPAPSGPRAGMLLSILQYTGQVHNPE